MSTLFPRPGRIAAATAGALLAALMTAGCHDDTPPAPTVVTAPAPAPTVVTSGGTAAPTAPGAVTPDTKINTNAGPGTSNGTDTATADKVNTAIEHNKQMTGARVDAVVTAGVATLTGQVQNQQQKALAESTARQVPGVSGIKNKLLIVTTGGAKPKPLVVTKTRTIIVHDKAAPADGTAGDASTPPPPAAPDAPAAPAPPAAPDNGNGTNNGAGNP